MSSFVAGSGSGSVRKSHVTRETFIPLYVKMVAEGKTPAQIAGLFGYSPASLKQRVKKINEELETAYTAGGVDTPTRKYLPIPLFEGGGKRGRKRGSPADLIALLGGLDIPQE